MLYQAVVNCVDKMYIHVYMIMTYIILCFKTWYVILHHLYRKVVSWNYELHTKLPTNLHMQIPATLQKIFPSSRTSTSYVSCDGHSKSPGVSGSLKGGKTCTKIWRRSLSSMQRLKIHLPTNHYKSLTQTTTHLLATPCCAEKAAIEIRSTTWGNQQRVLNEQLWYHWPITEFAQQ